MSPATYSLEVQNISKGAADGLQKMLATREIAGTEGSPAGSTYPLDEEYDYDPQSRTATFTNAGEKKLTPHENLQAAAIKYPESLFILDAYNVFHPSERTYFKNGRRYEAEQTISYGTYEEVLLRHGDHDSIAAEDI